MKKLIQKCNKEKQPLGTFFLCGDMDVFLCGNMDVLVVKELLKTYPLQLMLNLYLHLMRNNNMKKISF